MSHPSDPRRTTNIPPVVIIVGLVSVLFLGGGILVALTYGNGLDDRTTPLALTLMGLIASTVTSLVGALYSARTSADLRNGTVVAKVKEGTHEALREAEVVTRHGPVATESTRAMTEQTAALAELLRRTGGSAPEDFRS